MKLFVYLLVSSFLSTQALAQSWSSRQGPASLRQKSDNNYRDVWSLSDWFEVQRKNRLMDQWLAMNTSSNPFEFFVGAQTVTADSVTTTGGVQAAPREYRINKIQAGAYASIIGLEGEFADSKENYEYTEGSIHLRILGKNAQGTNLTGFYGMRFKDDKSLNTAEEVIQQNFTGGSLTLNLTPHAGVVGVYKKYLKDKSELGNEFEGSKIEGTFFIDFNFVRAYGTWFKEEEDYTNLTGPIIKHVERDGIFAGLKIFF